MKATVLSVDLNKGALVCNTRHLGVRSTTRADRALGAPVSLVMDVNSAAILHASEHGARQ